MMITETVPQGIGPNFHNELIAVDCSEGVMVHRDGYDSYIEYDNDIYPYASQKRSTLLQVCTNHNPLTPYQMPDDEALVSTIINETERLIIIPDPQRSQEDLSIIANALKTFSDGGII